MPPNILTPIRNLQSVGFHCYNVKFSPFPNNLIAVATGENFGIQGKGSLHIFDALLPGNPIIRKFYWQDVLFDLAWSPLNEKVLLTCSGDGTIQTWDLDNLHVSTQSWQAHTQEVSSIEWTAENGAPFFLSTSWDGHMKIWDINRSSPLIDLMPHQSLVYEASWSPLTHDIATVSGDGTAAIWSPLKTNQALVALPQHDSEILSCAWSYFDPNIIVTAATDSLLRGWDLRFPSSCIFAFAVHENPVRKVRFSPFHAEEMTSVSYDLTTRLWDISSSSGCVASCNVHSEFVYGLDYSTMDEGLIVDCSWDQYVTLYRALEHPDVGFP